MSRFYHSFVNIGPYQFMFWPRWTSLFFYRNQFTIYKWVVYLWPIEIRRFKTSWVKFRDDK